MRLFEIECGALYSDGHGNVREVIAVSATGDTVTYRHLMNQCITIKLGAKHTCTCDCRCVCAKHTCKRASFAEWAVRRFAGEDEEIPTEHP